MPALAFRLPTRDTVRRLCDVEVAPGQETLVSPVAVTLAQAPFEPGAVVRGAWDGDTPVGMLAMLDPRVPDPDGPREHPGDGAYLWRLLVGARHQGKGYGTAMLAEAARTARDWGQPRLYLTAVDAPGTAIPFYLRHGFRRTGRVLYGEEHLMVRDL